MSDGAPPSARDDGPRRDDAARRADPRVALLLALVALVVFARAAWLPFAAIDDAEYVASNPVVAGGLTRAGVAWAFGAFAASNWHPVTWLSHMLDVQLFGLAPAGHHATSVLLHAANVALAYLALARLTKAPRESAVVALLFAVHPLRVESVAWVAERKDVLSGFFFLLSLWLYARHAERPRAASLVAFTLALALGLASKPMLVTAPCVLLLLDAWPLRRFARVDWRWLVAEKLPAAALAGGTAWLTLRAQAGALDAVPLADRVDGATYAYATYLRRVVWPSDLAIYYPREAPGQLALAASVAALGALLLVALREWDERPWVPVGLAWFAGMLVPTIGLVSVGSAAMADRYTYLPVLGLLVALVFTVGDLARTHARVAPVAVVALALAVPALSLATVRQIGFLRSATAMWSRARDVGGESAMVEWGLASAATTEGNDGAAAIAHCRRVIALAPAHPFYLKRCGETLANLDRDAEAERALRAAVRVSGADPELRYELCSVMTKQRKIDAAVACTRDALAATPGVPQLTALAAFLDKVRASAPPASPRP